MANPVAVKGIKGLLDKLNGEITETAKKAVKNKFTCHVVGKLHMKGEFGFDKNGELGFVGSASIGVAGVEIVDTPEVEVEAGNDWSSTGAGQLELSYEVEVTV